MNFKKIDKNAFIRIWNSDFEDAYADSHRNCFEETLEEEWRPLFERHLKVMHEVEHEGELIGYVFLSPKDDGSAHLGYGLYKRFRGKGHSVKMCSEFLKHEIPKLSKDIKKILGTTLQDNRASQIVLEKLGFSLIGEIVEEGITYLRFERSL